MIPLTVREAPQGSTWGAEVPQPGEVLVSSTVKDLVAGSGIEFDDRGEHTLRGIAGAWRLYTPRASSAALNG